METEQLDSIRERRRAIQRGIEEAREQGKTFIVQEELKLRALQDECPHTNEVHCPQYDFKWHGCADCGRVRFDP